MIPRRSFLASMLGLAVAPAIVRADSLMRLRVERWRAAAGLQHLVNNPDDNWVRLWDGKPGDPAARLLCEFNLEPPRPAAAGLLCLNALSSGIIQHAGTIDTMELGRGNARLARLSGDDLRITSKHVQTGDVITVPAWALR